MDNETEINVQTDSLLQNLPSLDHYYNNLDGFILSAIIVGGILFLLNLAIYIQTVTKIVKRLQKQLLFYTLLLCGFYPIISGAAFLTILLPQSVIVCNSIMHFCFLLSACIFYKLCFLYVNGEENFLKEINAVGVLNLRTPPFCCCCICIPPLTPTKGKLFLTRLMIYQMLFIQGLILIVLNVVYFKIDYIFQNINLFFGPFILISILTGIWGLNIIARMLRTYAPDQNIMMKYFCTQLIIVFCKLQPIILELILGPVQIGNKDNSIQLTYKYAIIQLIILLEMFMLSILARKAYQNPI